jgi:hypothetical protein
MRAAALLLGVIVSLLVTCRMWFVLSLDPGVTLSTTIHVCVSVIAGLITLVLVTALSE